MLSLSQISDLHAAVRDPEFSKALKEFITSERLYLVNQAMDAIRENSMDEARKFAAQELAYSELFEKLRVFAERELQRL